MFSSLHHISFSWKGDTCVDLIVFFFVVVYLRDLNCFVMLEHFYLKTIPGKNVVAFSVRIICCANQNLFSSVTMTLLIMKTSRCVDSHYCVLGL